MQAASVAPPPSMMLLDDEISALIVQMEEIGIYAQSSKGKYPVDNPPDSEVAFMSLQAEVDAYRCFLDDKKLARSIAHAVHLDGAIITDLVSQDVQACEDRRLAQDLSGDYSDDQTSTHLTSTGSQHPLNECLSTGSDDFKTNSLVDGYDEADHAGPSMTFAERQAEALSRLSAQTQCSVCCEMHSSAKIIKTSCEHRYCIDCAKGLFMRSTKDETLFPPRCCRNRIPSAQVIWHMSPDESEKFEAATVEFTTGDRVYCSNRQCGLFVRPSLIESETKVATCDVCGTRTCSICKNEEHLDRDCPDDPAVHETRQLAQKMGWQTCPSCNTLVQLRSGCNHMTCRCKAEFCYVCGVKWKTCRCDVADVNRIYERAEEVVDRDAAPGLPPAERDQLVRRVQAVLQENHECQHSGRFQRVFGSGRRGFQCEFCDSRHWKYILQCRHCYVNVCEDCRRNRI